ncbi:MAG: right-handed parallel beta-helix repeat-containing protein [Thermoplasmata archaeon]|nr:right-handed parallel beta-helix repeat-containing protein [Thermoplasmata archaeon]
MGTKKGSLVVVFLVLASVSFATLTTVPLAAQATTLYVGGGGPSNYTTIQAAINASSAGDTIYVYSGIYLEHVLINRTLSMVGEDRNTTIIDGGGSGNVVKVTADWVNVTGFSVRGSGTDVSYAGIKLASVHNCSISNNEVFDNFNGIILSGSSSNAITNNTLSNNTLAFYIQISTNSTLIGNQMVGNGIFIWGGWGGRIEQWNTHTIDPSNTVNGKPVYHWKDISGGTIPPGAGQVLLVNCTDVVVKNQDLSNASVGMEISLSRNNTIMGNNVSGNDLVGIWVLSSDNNTISRNNISSNEDGISLYISNNNTFEENNVSLNLNGFSVFASSKFNNITSNVVNSNDGAGILILSDNNTVAGNTASFNVQAGIYLSSYGNNTIVHNNASHNGNGIYIILDSSNNTVAENVVSWNDGGIVLSMASFNRVYHNTIVGNTDQAYDDMDTNQWDDGYPSGGNYWSDYSGNDQLSGPLQNVIGSDGIGDTPYMIDINSWDRYPFMSPSGPIFPRPPLFLTARLSGRNMENVTLVWLGSSDDGGGLKSVVRYEVFRNSTYDSSGLSYGLVASVPNGTYRFVDSSVGEGNPNDYFYLVCAVDLNNNTTCVKNQAGKFTRPLSKGPNLVSTPLAQSDESIETVFQTLSYDNAWSYNPIDQEWKFSMKSKPYGGTLQNINHTMGLWVNVTQDSNLTVAGVVPTTTTINLQAGWNLVGFPSFDSNYMVADLKVAIAVERMEGFDGFAPPYFLRVMTDGDFLQAGFGYWIRVGSEASWTIVNT